MALFRHFTQVFAVLLVLLWTAEGSLEENTERVTTVECTTRAVDEPFTIEVYHDWAPLGAQRFVDLVEDQFFTDVAVFRCVKEFLGQFGISSDAEKKAKWNNLGPIEDDPPVGKPFTRGTLGFAGGGADTRTTQMYVTFADLPNMGSPEAPWEVPFGVVTEGMKTIVDKLYTGYGEQQPFNPNGVDQSRLQEEGNSYLRENFPEMSYLQECRVVASIATNDPLVEAEVEVGEDTEGIQSGDQAVELCTLEQELDSGCACQDETAGRMEGESLQSFEVETARHMEEAYLKQAEMETARGSEGEIPEENETETSGGMKEESPEQTVIETTRCIEESLEQTETETARGLEEASPEQIETEMGAGMEEESPGQTEAETVGGMEESVEQTETETVRVAEEFLEQTKVETIGGMEESLEQAEAETIGGVEGSQEGIEIETARRMEEESPEQIETEMGVVGMEEESPEQTEREAVGGLDEESPEQIEAETAGVMEKESPELTEAETIGGIEEESPELVETGTVAEDVLLKSETLEESSAESAGNSLAPSFFPSLVVVVIACFAWK